MPLTAQQAAAAGDRTAACNLGYLYETGEGVEQSWDQAVTWYRQAAEQGEARGQYLLGWCYEHGKGVPPSVEQAKQLYEASAKQDYKHAAEALERLKNGPGPESGKPGRGGKKPPEKKRPEKGGFLKGLFDHLK